MTDPINSSQNAMPLDAAVGAAARRYDLSGLQRRRWLVLALNIVTYAALLVAAASILASGGFSFLDLVLLTLFAIGTPWTVVGFWNAVIGLWLLKRGGDALPDVAPFLAGADVPTPLAIDTAVLMTLRNEDPARALARLKIVMDSLERTGEGARFGYFILSDSSRDDVIAAEAAAIAALRTAAPPGRRVVYRRRTENIGFKAGNVRDFCRQWGSDYELMLPLDADSLMAGDDIIRLVRIMQAHDNIGILQSLVVGMPTTSPFARIFQFGMRAGMRAYTMGQSWWVGDCGPFWGHNALVRIKPFVEHCDLPLLPGKPPLGGHVLSHDQVEATLMRRAGYEVRVMPVEGGSWEENPPSVLDFIERDVRWCQGNMQYINLLGLRGLLPISRFQLVWAILMFIGIPAWTLMIALLPAATLEAQGSSDFPATAAAVLYVVFFAMYLSPKFAGWIDAATSPAEVARFGGGWRFALSAAIEVLFSFLQGAITTIRTSLFMAGLPFGQSIVWSGQKREAGRLTWRTAATALWPQTLFGVLLFAALWIVSPVVLLWSLPLTAGYLLAVPFAVVTANPSLGAWMRRHRLCAIPEEIERPREIAEVEERRTGDAYAI